ncbi:MAG: TlpA family protein disulfide reductase [Pyrinomonadaceae bacterium MAG19_C2-C3]|nr:TlpA family protein disulfide reductase [Pyrinomonadaceae bacterium MAG19_C2-C3]
MLMMNRKSRSVVRRFPAAKLAAVFMLAVFAFSGGCRNTETGVTQNTTPSNQTSAARTQAPTKTGELPAGTLTAPAALLDGGTLRLEDYKGKVVVLDMWATWCPPCRAEIPHLVDIQREYGGRVEVIGLTTEDAATTTDKVKDFAEQFNINYKVGFAAPEHKRLVLMGGSSIPQTFVINGEGRVVRHFPGFHPTQTIPAMRQAIEDALAKTG